MKFMTMERKGLPMNLQFFAEGGDDDGGDGAGDGDDQDGDESDEDGDDAEEKKYTEKDIEEAVKKRLARERRKWKRQASASDNPDSGDKAGDGDQDNETYKERKAREEAEKKAEELENKWICLEHDVNKNSVDDVLALAKVYMSKDDGLDLEDAIDDVIKKYPQFSVVKDGGEDDQDNKGSWGQRQKGNSKKTTGVEAAFLARNPNLKV